MVLKKKKKIAHRVNWRTCKVNLKWICKLVDQWPFVLVIFTNLQATKLSYVPISETRIVCFAHVQIGSWLENSKCL